MDEDGVIKLIGSIIRLAKRDYYRACKHDSPASEYNSKATLESFFHSDWLQFLTLGRADPETLMAQARRREFGVF